MKNSVGLLLVFFIFCSVRGQEIIPFQLNAHHNMIVKGIINEKDTVNLMVQLAMRDASLAPNRTNKATSVVFDTSEISEGLSKTNRIQVAGRIVDKIWIWDNERTGYGAEGKIGTQLFDGKIVKINYDQAQFELYDHLPNTAGFIALPLSDENGRLFISVLSIVEDSTIETKVLLQSGFSGLILYNNQLADTYQLAEKLPVLNTQTLSNSAGQQVHNLICKMPAIQVGNIRFEEVPVNVFTGEIKNQTTSYAGADFIHRFNWIIDIEGGTAYIQKNRYFLDPYYFGQDKE